MRFGQVEGHNNTGKNIRTWYRKKGCLSGLVVWGTELVETIGFVFYNVYLLSFCIIEKGMYP